jgi:hypothetical protein
MKSVFLTEMGFQGQVPPDHPNLRTEFCWMLALEADHFNIYHYEMVKGYDVVFVIFPKAMVKLNAFGVELGDITTITKPAFPEDKVDYPDNKLHATPLPNELHSSITNDSYELKDIYKKQLSLYKFPIIETLRLHNKKVCFVQEGDHYLFNDYDMETQFHFYNQLADCDVLFAHNQTDAIFYKGLFQGKRVDVIPTLMYPPPLSEPAEKQNKVIISGNFCRWYGGFQSYMVAQTFDCPIYVPSSHCKRRGEEQVPNLTHLPWTNWTDWMQCLSNFKYAVNLMPTVAAGTFSLNCAYWGIPCIGNVEVDTQKDLFPHLSVHIHNVQGAMNRAEILKSEKMYSHMGRMANELMRNSWHFDRDKWLDHMERTVNG